VAHVLRLPALRLWSLRAPKRARPANPLAIAHWQRPDADPELAKALGKIQTHVAEAAALLDLPDASAPLRTADTKDRLRELLAADVDELTIDTAWEVAGALKRELLVLGDAQYVWSKLEYEAQRNAQRGRWHRWTDHFDAAALTDLLARRPTKQADPETQADVVWHLRHLYAERAEAGLERRARAKLKCRYLSVLVAVLSFCFLALALVLEEISGPGIWKSVALTASAGALGATLSGVFRVRDKLTELDDLRSFSPAMRAQPLVGAVAGLVVLLVLESGAVALGTGNASGPAAQALLAFSAGFSEPFFLGIVQRVTVIPDKEGGRASA
jgi:hypothetical protein